MGNTALIQPVRKFHYKKGQKPDQKSDVWWLRKKVPQRYRAVVGRSEVWRSLETTDRKKAGQLCVELSADLDREWEHRLQAAAAAGRPVVAPGISAREISGLQRLAHEQTRDARIDNPPASARWGFGTGQRGKELDLAEEECGIIFNIIGPRAEDANLAEREYDEQDLEQFLVRNGHELNTADRARFLPLFLEARREGYRDLHRAATEHDFSESAVLGKRAPSPAKKIDFPKAFEFYCEKSGIKGGATGATAKRWRPKITAFCEFLGHSDLGRVTTDDGYRWADHLIERGVTKKSVRDVWIASLKATAGFLVERRKIEKNPFAGIRIRGVKGTQDTNRKGFSDSQAATILTATLAIPSHLTTPETRAARRWVPWICAYTSARVNEITSLLPTDVRQDAETGIWCIYLRPEMTKGKYERVVPIHSHLLEQGFLKFVEQRRKSRLPLFYDPKRARGGENANPQWQKVAQRLAEWVVDSLKVTGVKPNHGWRHRFKSIARHVHMHPEVEKFITGHGGSDDPDSIAKVSMQYGDAWVKTLANNIEMYPRYDIAALRKTPVPLKRTRRSPAQIAADQAARRSAGRRPASSHRGRISA